SWWPAASRAEAARSTGRSRSSRLERAEHHRALGADRAALLGAQAGRELVELARRACDGEGDLGAEQVGVLDDLAAQAELVGPAAHRLLEFLADHLADERHQRAGARL